MIYFVFVFLLFFSSFLMQVKSCAKIGFNLDASSAVSIQV